MLEEEKVKRSRRRADNRRKNERDALPRIKTDPKAWSKSNKIKKEHYDAEEFDGGVS